MWFKFTTDLKREKVVKRCIRALGKGDREGYLRFFVLLEIFSESITGEYWSDYNDLSNSLDIPAKQAELVWGVCSEENVLRRYQNGYSAIEWLREKKLIGDQSQKVTASKVSFF